MQSVVPLCTAPVLGGCGKQCARTPRGFRTLCSGHVARKKRGLPLDLPIGALGVGRKRTAPRVGELFPTTCQACGKTRLLRNNPTSRRNCVCASCQRRGKATRVAWNAPEEVIMKYMGGISAAQLAVVNYIATNTVLRALKRHGVQLRSMSEAIRLTDGAARITAGAKMMRATGELSRRMSAGQQKISLENWSGFRSDHWHRERSSGLWSAWRRSVFERDQYRCVDCRRAQLARPNRIEPHHIWPKAKYPQRLYDVNNGVTLCAPCHRATFGKEESLAPKYEAYVASL